MDNVIAFPAATKIEDCDDAIPHGSKTLFMHVKRATLIVHLSGRVDAVAANNVAQKST